MRTYFPVIALAAVGAGGLLFACTVTTTTNNNGTTGDDAGETPDAGTTTTTPDGGTVVTDDGAVTVDSGDAATATPQAYIRIAQWSPDAPAVDVCINQAAGDWTGQTPQLAQIVADADGGALGDGGATGITFPQVTSYLIIPPDTYEVRLVAAGSADCSTGLVDLTSVTIAANTYTTIAAVGEQAPVGGDQALVLTPLSDEVTAPAGQIALRFVNASPSQSLTPADLGTGSLAGTGGPWAPVFTGVAFGQTGATSGSDAGAVDANGYVAMGQLSTATLSSHQSMSAQDATIALNDVSIAATSAATVALVNGVSNGLAASAVKLLQCADVDNSAGASLLTTCNIISTQ
jgi:Domain of unknown function (DUF4397)